MGEDSKEGAFAFLEDEIKLIVGDEFDYEACKEFVFSTPSNRIHRFDILKNVLGRAKTLQFRLHCIVLHFYSNEEIITEIAEQSRNPLLEQELSNELDRFMQTSYRFEPKFSKHLHHWMDERGMERWILISERCSQLDPSSYPSLENIGHLFNSSENYHLIEERLKELELQEEKQRSSINDMCRYLANQGLDITKIQGLGLVESFDAIAKFQEFLDEKERVKISILTPVKDFDLATYNSFLEDLSRCNSPNDVQLLTRLRVQIQDVLFGLEEKLQQANDLKFTLQRQGIEFESSSPLKPKDLRRWEEEMSVQIDEYNLHIYLIEQWQNIIKIFPDHERFSSQFIGDIGKNSEFKEHLEMLDLRRKQTEIDGLQMIESFERYGIEMGEWKAKFIDNSIEALSEFKQYQEMLQYACSLIDTLLEIDVSYDGLTQRDEMLHRLKYDFIHPELLTEVEDFIAWKEKRNKRHRALLDEDAKGLEIDVRTKMASMALADYERAIAQHQAKRKHLLSKHSQSKRMVLYVEQTIKKLGSQGWDTSQFPSLSDENSVEIATMLYGCQKHLDSFNQLRKRLLRLPWNRDVALAIDISQRLRNPLELKSLNDEIPMLIQHLSKKQVEDEHFTLHLWAPKALLPMLMPLDSPQKTLIPIDSTTLDDAHEAMLEAMEPFIESEDFEALALVEDEHSTQTSIDDVDVVRVESALIPPKDQPMIEEKTEPIEEVKVAISVKELSPQKEKHTDELSQMIGYFCGALGLKKSQDAIREGVGGLDYARRNLAKQVGLVPRDLRVDRMLRIALRCFPTEGDSAESIERKAKIINSLTQSLDGYQRWMRNRLEHRHSSASGVFLQDARTLGVALQRIPGPGIKVPLDADMTKLPNDIEKLEEMATSLRQSMKLPSAGGMAVVSA
ncbi:MAG: hypothetical protein O3A74_01600 [archaeon]|nr:hypothetical protein [archaeon]